MLRFRADASATEFVPTGLARPFGAGSPSLGPTQRRPSLDFSRRGGDRDHLGCHPTPHPPPIRRWIAAAAQSVAATPLPQL